MSIELDNWLKRISIDYYTMFIQSWIPFNAWYNRNYYDEFLRRTSDRSIIDYIKQNDNEYKNKIKNLLLNTSIDAIHFKNHIYNLHLELEAKSIPNADNRIGFSNINLSKNSSNSKNISFKRKIYLFEYLENQPRNTKRFKCTIMKNNPSTTTEEIIELFTCKRSELEQELAYQNKTEVIQKKLIEGFNDINPQKPINIISPNSSGIKVNETLYFINNIDLASQVLIELIYQLRCKIFHGEINPNENYLKLYEYAYGVQKMLVQSLN